MSDPILYKKIISVQEDEDGELFLEFPDDLLEAMDWKAGDHLVWTKVETPNGVGFTVGKVPTYD
jgi:hypothetical protein